MALRDVDRLLLVSGNEVGRRVTQHGNVIAAAQSAGVSFLVYTSATGADYAAGAVAVLLGQEHTGRVYELSGHGAWDYQELAATIGRIIGQPVHYRPVGAQTLVAELTAVGVDEGTAGFVAALDTNIADGLLAGTSGELSQLIGRPTTSLYDGLRAAVS